MAVTLTNVILKKITGGHLVVELEDGRVLPVHRNQIVSTDLVDVEDVGQIELTDKFASFKELS